MSTEWNEENIREHLFTEVELSNNSRAWCKIKLDGYRKNSTHPFITGDQGWARMRLITKPKKRLMKPIELWGKLLDFAEKGMTTVIEFDNKFVFSRENKYSIQALEDSPNCQGWRDTPTSELNTSFEVDE